MLDQLFHYINIAEDFVWVYFGLTLIFVFGLYFSFKSRWMQLTSLGGVMKNFSAFMRPEIRKPPRGVHPLKVFFASIGGAIGVGNIVAVVIAVRLGGPGVLFWLWIMAILGMIIKYSEVYLGHKFRIHSEADGYDGGPMYYLQHAFKGTVGKTIAVTACILLMIYGAEVYIFAVVADSITVNTGVDKTIVTIILLALVLFAVLGGVSRVGQVSSTLIPIFLVLYFGMGLWIIALNITELPGVLALVVKSAFTGHEAVGGFVGASMLLAITQGFMRGAYSGDIGVGYASIMHSETSNPHPGKQASLAILGVFLDTLVLTFSVLVVLLTGAWIADADIQTVTLVQSVFSDYFPYMHFFMPLFLFLLGYSTIIAFFMAGIKCAKFISPKMVWFYYAYGVAVFLLSSQISTDKLLSVMALSGGLLLVINTIGFFKLRKHIEWNISD